MKWYWTPGGIIRAFMALSAWISGGLLLDRGYDILGYILIIIGFLIMLAGYIKTFQNIKHINKEVGKNEKMD